MSNSGAQKIFNNSLLYSLGMIFSKAVGFFLVPIYTFFISEADYGIATTITTFVSTFGIVVMLSLRAAMIRFYNEHSEEERPRFVGTIVTFVMANAALVCLLLCLLQRLYVPFLFRDIDFFPCVFWGILSLGAEGIYLVYQSLLQAKQDGKKYSVNSVLYLFAHALFVVLFVVVLRMDALGMVLANFATNVLFAAYGVFSMRRTGQMRFGIQKSMLSKSLKYSLPILPHNLSANANVYATKLVVNHFLGYALSGLYTLAAQFSTILGLVQSSINLAFRPWFIEQMQSGEEGRALIKKMTCMIMSLYSFCAVGISLFSKEIVVLIADNQYVESWKMIPFFVFSQLVSFIYYSHVQTLMYNVKKSKFTVICSSSGVVANLVLALILVRYWHVYGILVAQIVSQAVMALITVIMSNRAEYVDFGLPKMLVYLAGAAVFMGAGFLISFRETASLSLVGILLKGCILLISLMVFLFPYRRDYKELISGIFKKRSKED